MIEMLKKIESIVSEYYGKHAEEFMKKTIESLEMDIKIAVEYTEYVSKRLGVSQHDYLAKKDLFINIFSIMKGGGD